jgi:putative DNA primase/helicase
MSENETAADHLPKILPHHLTHLRASGLSDATIKAAGLYSETKPEALAALLGWRKPTKGLAPAIVFPFVAADGRNGCSRVRPDTPRKIAGKPVKYESPRGQPNQVYIPPGGGRVLDDATVELLITEGEKKSLCSTQYGFACLGLVGVYGWKEKKGEHLLPELERVAWKGRKVFVVFDSDIGRKPDVQLAEARLAKHLSDRGAVVRCVRLPDGSAGDDGQPVKVGLDDFLLAHGPAEFRKLLDTAVEPEPLEGADTKARADSIEPASTGAAFLSEHESDGVPRLRFWRGSFHLWHAGRYVELEPSEIQAELIRSINRDYIFLTTGIVGNVLAQVKAQAALPSRWEPPRWLDTPTVPWPAAEVLATRGELVHLTTLIAGREPFAIPATPLYFNQSSLDYDFAPDAPRPELWLGFLDQLFLDDSESITTLAEWFGYTLTGDTSQQKIMMLIGPPRAGKGVVARVLTRLIGPANVCGPTLASLESHFGLSPLLGKSLAIIGDARLSSKADQCKIVERLLSISGEDSLSVDRKFREPVTGKIPARLMLISNELPRLAESSGSLANRMIILRLTRSFLGGEDTELTAKLCGELPGILLWAVAGWQRLRERGHFVQPESGRELAETMGDLASPIAMFVRECCIVGPQYSAAVDDVYAAWREWCEANGRDRPGTKQSFGRDLRAALPMLRDSRRGDGNVRYRQYEGIAITS